MGLVKRLVVANRLVFEVQLFGSEVKANQTEECGTPPTKVKLSKTPKSIIFGEISEIEVFVALGGKDSI